uniref:DCB domain-containing protein n=1 Tax=Macrostomum lignano TaxID=282301 RepID=A0A1I8F7Q0_9PLAT
MQDEAKEKSESLSCCSLILTLVTDPLVQELTAETIADLDQLARDGSRTEKIDDAKASLKEMLETAKRNCGDALDGLKPDECSTNWPARRDGFYTAEEEAGKAESPIESKALVGDVLEKAKLDGVALQKSFASGLFVELLLGKLKNKTKDFTDPAEYEALLLEVSIGAAIEKIFVIKFANLNYVFNSGAVNANICESFNEYAASELLGAVVSATVRQSVVKSACSAALAGRCRRLLEGPGNGLPARGDSPPALSGREIGWGRRRVCRRLGSSGREDPTAVEIPCRSLLMDSCPIGGTRWRLTAVTCIARLIRFHSPLFKMFLPPPTAVAATELLPRRLLNQVAV